VSEKKGQCPFIIKKHVCHYGQYCIEDLQKRNSSMPHELNDCPVAQRQIEGNTWKTERPIRWVYDNEGPVVGSHTVPDGCCVLCLHDCGKGKYICKANPCPTCPILNNCYVGKMGEYPKASFGGRQ
jgi:hypothetical protein